MMRTEEQARPLVEASEVAARYGLALSTVYAMSREQRIPTFKIGRVYRYDPVEVERALARPAVRR